MQWAWGNACEHQLVLCSGESPPWTLRSAPGVLAPPGHVWVPQRGSQDFIGLPHFAGVCQSPQSGALPGPGGRPPGWGGFAGYFSLGGSYRGFGVNSPPKRRWSAKTRSGRRVSDLRPWGPAPAAGARAPSTHSTAPISSPCSCSGWLPSGWRGRIPSRGSPHTDGFAFPLSGRGRALRDGPVPPADVHPPGDRARGLLPPLQRYDPPWPLPAQCPPGGRGPVPLREAGHLHNSAPNKWSMSVGNDSLACGVCDLGWSILGR